MRLARILLMATAAVAVGLVGAGPAWAAGETVVTYTGSPSAGFEIEVKAAPGQSNSILVRRDSDPGFYILGDPIGIVEASPYCTQQSATRVRCQSEGLRAVDLDAGDGADSIVLGKGDVGWLKGVGATATGGPGGDTARAQIIGGAAAGSVAIAGGRGPDQLRLSGAGSLLGQGGNDNLRGLVGPQRIFGGRGIDKLPSAGAGKDLCRGGPGRDVGSARGCEQGIWEQDPLTS